MNSTIHSDQLRVTSIPYKALGFIIFSGVPIERDSYKINDGKYYITIKSKLELLPVEPSIGQYWRVEGTRIIEDIELDNYVMQQHTYTSPINTICTLPETGEQLIRFIAKEKDFKGIGESKARALWQLFGKKLHEKLQKDNSKNRAELRQVLSEESINSLYLGYAKYKNLAHCNWMSEYKIPSSIQQRLLKFHDEDTVNSIRSNPYLLIGFGMSFNEVDELAQTKFEVDLDSPLRLSAALEFSISVEVSRGHTFTTHQRLKPLLMKCLKSGELVSLAFQVGYSSVQYLLNSDTGTYHPTAQLLMESVVAKRFLLLATNNNLYNETVRQANQLALQELHYELTSKQSEAITTSLSHAISCITGGAGTGKTTVLRTVLKSYREMGFELHAVALSGRAAMRLYESIGFKTLTIAAFLRKEPVTPSFNKPNHVLVIDEASMIDLPTMYRLVTHVHPSVRLIFTGDPDQLPPIGCGKVLADLVDSKCIANTKLDIVKRQKCSSGIPEYSSLINQGVVPKKLSSGKIYFHNTSDKLIKNVCAELYQQSPRNSRVIAPTIALVDDINKSIQNSLNPNGQAMQFFMHGEAYFRGDLREGDEVLFVQNNYERGIQNGTLATLTSVDSTGNEYGELQLDTGQFVSITQDLLDSMMLGYCITLHKAQGSQFPRVIVALQKGRITDRAWLYTAITRAEHEVHIVGDESYFAEVVKAIGYVSLRRSFLPNLLFKLAT